MALLAEGSPAPTHNREANGQILKIVGWGSGEENDRGVFHIWKDSAPWF